LFRTSGFDAAAAAAPPMPTSRRRLRSLWLRFFSTRDQALSRLSTIFFSSRLSFGSRLSLVARAKKPTLRAARRWAIVPWLIAESSSLRNFLSFASELAKSVALEALSRNAAVLLRLNMVSLPLNGFLLPVPPIGQAKRSCDSRASASRSSAGGAHKTEERPGRA
jgi:hypothetical protein